MQLPAIAADWHGVIPCAVNKRLSVARSVSVYLPQAIYLQILMSWSALAFPPSSFQAELVSQFPFIPQNFSSTRKMTLTSEHKGNYVLSTFFLWREVIMIRAIVEEAAALASLALFLGMVAIWAQVIATL